MNSIATIAISVLGIGEPSPAESLETARQMAMCAGYAEHAAGRSDDRDQLLDGSGALAIAALSRMSDEEFVRFAGPYREFGREFSAGTVVAALRTFAQMELIVTNAEPGGDVELAEAVAHAEARATLAESRFQQANCELFLE